jgi:hypothetical protein
MQTLIAGPAFDAAVPQLLITLEQAPDRAYDLILAAAERFVGEHPKELGDISTAAAGEARDLSSLVTRAYAQVTSDEARERALDLIDDLLLAGAYGVETALDDARR